MASGAETHPHPSAVNKAAVTLRRVETVMSGFGSLQNQVNAVGGIALLIIGGYAAFEVSKSRDAKPCSSRFPSATEMSLQKANGVALSPAELQARAGVAERGMIEKASVRKGDGGPTALALDVRVGGPKSSDTGIGFTWAPSTFGKVETACLVYSVHLPADFDFANGGVLPGLYGQANASTPGNQKGFSARMTWNETVVLGVEAVTADIRTSDHEPVGRIEAAGSELKRGRWTHIEQELVLNSADSADGIVRVWIDGRLRLEDKELGWRAHPTLKVSGVMADVAYSGAETTAAKRAGVISLSAPRLSWR